MRWAWIAVALAGCGVAAAHPTATPACGGVSVPSHLGAIHFLNPELGVGLTMPAPRCGAMLAVSRDGGRRWTTEGKGLAEQGRTEQLVATSTRRAWAVVGAGRLMSTTDGGATWTPETPPPQLALAGERRIVIIGDGTVVVVADRRFAERRDPTWMGRPCQAAGLAAAGRSWWVLCRGAAAAGSSERPCWARPTEDRAGASSRR